MTISQTKSGRSGFTFLELLVVIVIIGIMAAMIGPALTSTDIVRVKTASRGLMQLSRYARTMAVLHQQTMMLTITSDGKLSVTPKGPSSSAGASSAEAESSEEGVAQASSRSPDKKSKTAEKSGKLVDRRENQDAENQTEGSVPDVGSEMSEAETKKEYKQVSFTVELDESQLQDEEEGKEMVTQETDKDAESAEGSVQTVKSASIPYAGNGRCLPYRVVIAPVNDKGEPEESGWKLELTVDRFGNARILDEDEDRKRVHSH